MPVSADIVLNSLYTYRNTSNLTISGKEATCKTIVDGYIGETTKHIKNTKIRNIKNDLVTKNKSLIIPKDVFVEKLKITKNADMNSDGEVNGLDTSILIEKQLGK